MKPSEAIALQIQRYRAMSGAERLTLALELHELACEIARSGIKAQHPAADAGEIERLLKQRLSLAYSGPKLIKS